MALLQFSALLHAAGLAADENNISGGSDGIYGVCSLHLELERASFFVFYVGRLVVWSVEHVFHALSFILPSLSTYLV